ncbi:sensor histidine kinase, partial [Proteus mirabilis]|uniref:sensor histidine kinase n=1 Tax=Proteus mirabilis TaxID=584 RepID=UPI0013D782D4
RLLVRELHHRVKNSLQIVQSYLSLAKRNYSAEASRALSEAEWRVQVLAIAYRFSLAHGEMHAVRVDVFLEEVLAAISRLLPRP